MKLRVSMVASLLIQASFAVAQIDTSASQSAASIAQGPSSAPTTVKPASPPPAYQADPKFVAEMKEAKELEQHRQYAFALDGYKKANKIAGGSCLPCLKKIYGLQFGIGNYKDAAATAAQRESLAQDARENPSPQPSGAPRCLPKAGRSPSLPNLMRRMPPFSRL